MKKDTNKIELLKKHQIKLIEKNSKYFPKKLHDLPDCPDVLFVLGNEKILNSFSISIVGTRNSSEEGNEIAHNLAKDLASNNITIVSGLASGIDSQAHSGALIIGKTIAIIACGFEYILKSSKQKLINSILNNGGAIITEYFPDTPPQKFSFLNRNRLIAAISDGLIVVEAPSKSGALNTTQIALKLSKPIFAVPWNISTFRGVGCNNLILQGAHILTNYIQVLEYFKLKHSSNSCNISFSKPYIPDDSYLNTSFSKPNFYDNSSLKISSHDIPKKFLKLYKFIAQNEPVSKETIHASNIDNTAIINSTLILMELENFITLTRKQILYKKNENLKLKIFYFHILSKVRL